MPGMMIILLFLLSISVSEAQNTSYAYTEDPGEVPPIVIVFLVVWSILAFFIIRQRFRRMQPPEWRAPGLSAVQQTMSERRRQQRQNNNTQAVVELTEEERNNARYELFLTKFHFQAVLPDKSNITANSLRRAESNRPDEEHPSNKHDDDDDDHASAVGPRQNSLSQRLSSWRRPSPRDECCICLECYTEGETICAAMTTECNHVFHEGCILEWLKTKDRCPLCRVELLKD